jgi:membrane protein implicated in regulation of membrane protease activity
MSQQNPRSRHPVTWAVLTILILAPIVGTLWVPFYARATPEVAGFPFFYWYQLIWVPIVAVTSGLAYALLRRTGRPRSGPGAASGPDAEGPGTGKRTVQAP